MIISSDDNLRNVPNDDALLVQAAEAADRQYTHQKASGRDFRVMGSGREPVVHRRSQRYGTDEQVASLHPLQRGQFIPRQNLAHALTQGLRTAVTNILNAQKIPNDRFYLSLLSERLKHANNAFHLTAGKWHTNAERAQALFKNLSKLLTRTNNLKWMTL